MTATSVEPLVDDRRLAAQGVTQQRVELTGRRAARLEDSTGAAQPRLRSRRQGLGRNIGGEPAPAGGPSTTAATRTTSRVSARWPGAAPRTSSPVVLASRAKAVSDRRCAASSDDCASTAVQRPARLPGHPPTPVDGAPDHRNRGVRAQHQQPAFADVHVYGHGQAEFVDGESRERDPPALDLHQRTAGRRRPQPLSHRRSAPTFGPQGPAGRPLRRQEHTEPAQEDASPSAGKAAPSITCIAATVPPPGRLSAAWPTARPALDSRRPLPEVV